MPKHMDKYMVTFMVDDGWHPQKYRNFEAPDDASAVQTGTAMANAYIRSGEKPRLLSAHVSKWKALSFYKNNGMWSSVHGGDLKRGKQLLRGEVQTCSCCGGSGQIVPTK